MFNTGNTNLFFSHKSIKDLFHTASLELSKVFNANKLSLNKNKTKYTLFHKAREDDNLPLKLPSSFVRDGEITRITSIKYLRSLIDLERTYYFN